MVRTAAATISVDAFGTPRPSYLQTEAQRAAFVGEAQTWIGLEKRLRATRNPAGPEGRSSWGFAQTLLTTLSGLLQTEEERRRPNRLRWLGWPRDRIVWLSERTSIATS